MELVGEVGIGVRWCGGLDWVVLVWVGKMGAGLVYIKLNWVKVGLVELGWV